MGWLEFTDNPGNFDDVDNIKFAILSDDEVLSHSRSKVRELGLG